VQWAQLSTHNYFQANPEELQKVIIWNHTPMVDEEESKYVQTYRFPYRQPSNDEYCGCCALQ
jgi:hypothetical protein